MIHEILFGEGFKYVFWMRTYKFLSKNIITKIVRIPVSLILTHYKYLLGIDISPDAQIGPGLFIGHFGGIVVSNKAKIGSNCNLSLGVVIGETFGGQNPGVPTIGNSVYIGPGAKIIGKIMVGNEAAIGAGAVVVSDVPDGCVVAGNPARIVSLDGSKAYITNTVVPVCDAC